MRAIATLLHRWAGLAIAGFLTVSGLTGAVISWDHELDEVLNPHLTRARDSGAPIASLELARRIEARHPQVIVTGIPLRTEPGHSLAFGVAPRVDPATGKLHEPGFNQVFVDPASGAELGKREWGAVWPVTRETFVSFLYKFHYSLHLPEMGGIDRWGLWLLGVIAMIWTFDCFIGAYLTLPVRRREARVDDEGGEDTVVRGRTWWQRWQPAWRVRWKGGPARLNFDLHRAFSLWTWALLFVIAFTAFSLNLYRELFLPLISSISSLTPTPYTERPLAPKHRPNEPRVGFAEVIERARAEAAARAWLEPMGSAFFNRSYGFYGVQFFYPENDHGTGGAGHKRLYYDGLDGRLIGDRLPWTGTAADIFVQAQFPLHSGRILGVPGRILISLMGVVVAMLSITGVVVWMRKRRARLLAWARTQGQAPAQAPLRPAGAWMRR